MYEEQLLEEGVDMKSQKQQCCDQVFFILYCFFSVLYLIIITPISIIVWCFCCIPSSIECFRCCRRGRLHSLEKAGFDKSNVNIYFDGAAFALFYYMGVLKYFEQNVDIKNVKFFANSAGNLAVLFYLAGETVTEEIINEWMVLAKSEAMTRLGFGFCGKLGWLRTFLDKVMPDDILDRVAGRYCVGICNYPFGTFEFISDFRSRDHLIECVISSCSFPMFVWGPNCWSDGRCWYDGGCAQICDPIDENFDITVRVINSRESFNTIQPTKRLKPRDFLCWPVPGTVDNRVQFGYDDCADYFQNREYLQRFLKDDSTIEVKSSSSIERFSKYDAKMIEGKQTSSPLRAREEEIISIIENESIELVDVVNAGNGDSVAL